MKTYPVFDLDEAWRHPFSLNVDAFVSFALAIVIILKSDPGFGPVSDLRSAS